MRKINYLLILTLPIAAGLSACGKKDELPAPSPAPETTSYSEQAAPAPAPAPVPAPTPEPMPAPVPPVPAEAAAPPVAPEPQRYTVGAGDTLYRIAHDNGVSVDDLMRWNDIKRPNRLKVGQELQLSAPMH
jgi:LysM repeat protein